MNKILDELKPCLYKYLGAFNNATFIDTHEGLFTDWLLKSNCSKVRPYLKEKRGKIKSILETIEYECLQEILNVLMKSPEADYFWYDRNGELTWADPEQNEVHVDSLRVNKERIKIFLRDIKINQVLN